MSFKGVLYYGNFEMMNYQNDLFNLGIVMLFMFVIVPKVVGVMLLFMICVDVELSVDYDVIEVRVLVNGSNDLEIVWIKAVLFGNGGQMWLLV